MLPILLLVGFVWGAVVRRAAWWLLVVMGLAWALAIATSVSTDFDTVGLACLLGVANTLVGLLAGRSLRLAEGLAQRIRRA